VVATDPARLNCSWGLFKEGELEAGWAQKRVVINETMNMKEHQGILPAFIQPPSDDGGVSAQKTYEIWNEIQSNASQDLGGGKIRVDHLYP